MEVLTIFLIGGMIFYFSLKNEKRNREEAIQRLIILEETQQTMNRIESQMIDVQNDIQWRIAHSHEYMEESFEKVTKRQEDLHFVLSQLFDIPDYDPDNTNSHY